MRMMTWPALGLVAVALLAGGPARADDCEDQAAAYQQRLQSVTATSQDRAKMAGQISQGLANCKKGENNPWLGVDPRVRGR